MKLVKRLLGFLLAVMMVVVIIPMQTLAVSLDSETESILRDFLYQKQYVNCNQTKGSGDCVVCSIAMLLRRAAIINGTSRDIWGAYDQNSVIRKNGGSNSVGQFSDTIDGHTYTLAWKGRVSCINPGVQKYGSQKKWLIAFLEEHPEGIVIYGRKGTAESWHAAIVTHYDETEDTFYCMDPANNYNSLGTGMVPLKDTVVGRSYLGGSTQDSMVNSENLVTVWYVQSGINYHAHDWSNTGLCCCGAKYGDWVRNQGTDLYQCVKGTLTPASGSAIYVKQQPYKEPAGQYLAKVKSCDAIALLTNTIGNRWYEVKYTENGTDKTGYVYSGDAKFVKATNKLEAKCALAGKFNGKITEGTSLWAKNGDYSGSIASSDGVTKLTKVVFGIYNYSTGAATSARNVVTKTNIGSPKYAINSTDDTILFSSLSPGQYTFKIEGYADGTASASASFDFYVVSKTPPATSQITTTTATVEKHFNQLKKMATDGKFFTTGDGSKPCYLSNHRTENCSSSSGKPCCNVAAVCTQNWLLNYVDYKPGSTSYLVKQYYPSGGTGNLGDSCFGFACYAMWYIYSTAGNQDIIGTLSTVSTYNKESVAKIVQQGQLKKGNIIRFSGGHSVIFDKIDPNGNGIYVLDCNWNNQSVGSSKIQYHIIDYNNSYYKDNQIAVTCAGNVTVADQPTTYTVSYNANGGSGAPSAQTKTKDVSLTLSTTRPTRAGYNFLGWATSSSAASAQYQPGSTYTANANVTLYAVWEELNTIAINAANFPDANFRAVVSAFDKNGDGKLNEAEITAVAVIECYEKNISNLNGIEYFTALEWLYCNNNQLTTLDVSKNTALTTLRCYGNQLTALDVSKNTALTKLYCETNNLTTLDVSKNTALTKLRCNNNQLTSLDVSKNTALTQLWCYNNRLTNLDVSKNTALTELCCESNQLTTLDVSKNTALKGLGCDGNQLTTLDVRRNTALESLSCFANHLTTLDVSKNTALTNLYCVTNNLTTLDVSKNTALTKLRCNNNQLTSLDVSKNTALMYLDCESNQLTSLDVSRNTALTDLSCENNSYDITLNANRSYDLSKLPGNFNASKAKSWNGCTIQGSVIKVNAGVNEVSYTYDCGNGKTMPVTLNVVGVEAPATYTVSYNANGGSGAPSAQTKTKDVSLTLSTTRPTRTGYNFLGWATSSSATSAQYQPGSTYTANANITLYAVWEELNTIAINAANFPDANFRAVVSTFDKNGDGKLNEAEITAVTKINCREKNISNLKGIEYFTALERLSCDSNQLTTLDVSKNTALKELYCGWNQLTTLGVSNNTALTVLSCYKNQLTALDVSKNTALERLYCHENQLTALDVSKNTALTYLHCESNQLTSLDVSKNTALTNFGCEKNSYDITLNANRSYDLSKLPGSFDVSKAKARNGCTIQGSIIKVNAGVNEVSYTYDCGNGKTLPVTLNVVGVEAPPVTYTVTYRSNTGDVGVCTNIPDTKEYSLDSIVTIPEKIPTRPNGKFMYWQEANTNKLYQPGDTVTIKGNMELVAIWALDWSHEKNGLFVGIDCVSVTPGETVDIPVFINYESRAVLSLEGEYSSFEYETETGGPLPKFVRYIPKEKPEKTMPGCYVIGIARYDIPKDLNLAGKYYFHLDNISDLTILDENGPLVVIRNNIYPASGEQAKARNGWTLNTPEATTFTVRFNANGGYGSMAAVSNVSGPYTLPSCTFEAPSGKQFKGWATSPNGAVITGTYNVTANITFYAIWEAIPAADGTTLQIGKAVSVREKEVIVPISISNNTGVAGMNFKINYDKTRLQLTGFEDAQLTGWMVGVGSGEKANWFDENGSSINGDILFLKFMVLDTAEDGLAEITVTGTDIVNANEEEVSVTVVPGGIEVISRIPGDTNDDGKISAADVLRLRKYLAGMEVEINLLNADVTGDGKVSAADVLRLRKYLAGMDVVLQ